MENRRILHVYKYFRPIFTGEGVFLERLAPIFEGLNPAIRHDVLVTHTPMPLEGPPRAKGLDLIVYLSSLAAPASQAEIVGWLWRNAGYYDVVHFHTHVDRTFAGILSLKSGGARIVFSATLDDSIKGLLDTYGSLTGKIAKRLFSLVDAFVAISPRLQAENAEFAPLEKTFLIPMGIPLRDPDREAGAKIRVTLGIPSKKKVLICVGGICDRKDQIFLVERLAALLPDHPDLLLLLVGPVVEKDYDASLKARIEGLGLGEHVVFAGRVDDPFDYYAAADFMVFASKEEGFGTVMIEGMSAGLPLLARRLAGVNDAFIEDGRTGRLFETASEFDGKMRGLLVDPTTASGIGDRARMSIRREFDIVDTAKSYLRVYFPQTEPFA